MVIGLYPLHKAPEIHFRVLGGGVFSIAKSPLRTTCPFKSFDISLCFHSYTKVEHIFCSDFSKNGHLGGGRWFLGTPVILGKI